MTALTLRPNSPTSPRTDTDHLKSAKGLNTLIDAAGKWRDELHAYVIPSASESSAQDAASYTAQADRIELALAHFTKSPEQQYVTVKSPEQLAADMVDPAGDETALLRDFPDSRKPDVVAAIVAAIKQDQAQRTGFTALGLEVQVWQSDLDGVDVVQIDTADHDGRFRINVNEAPVWDLDPESTGNQPECTRCGAEPGWANNPPIQLDENGECVVCRNATRCPNCGQNTDDQDGRERFKDWCTSCVHDAERCGA